MPAAITFERPSLYPKQEAAIFDPARYSIIEASTKSGKTVGCIAWIIEQAMAGQRGWNYWWVAPWYGTAQIAYRRIKEGLPSKTFTSNESKLTITLKNGAVLWFKGGERPDTLYGEDVHAVVIDEASRTREEAWIAIRTTITHTRAPVRIIGNVKGRKNWAYLMGRRAESGEPDMAYHKITWHDAVAAEILELGEIEDVKRSGIPENVFRELYEAEASDDQGNPFGIEAIRSNIAPIVDTDPAIWGIDLAKSVDWTVEIALDRDGNTCRFERFQKPWTETIGTIANTVDDGTAIVDSTGVGDPIVEQLQRQATRGTFHAFHFTSSSKQKIMEGLAVAIQQGRIKYPDGPIVQELEQFEYVYTHTGVSYSAPSGMHDDCVCALALAVSGLPENDNVADFFGVIECGNCGQVYVPFPDDPRCPRCATAIGAAV